VQELVHEDFDRRIEFCEFIDARGNDFVNNIVFSNKADKASFELHRNVNRQNFRLKHRKFTLDNKSDK